MSKMSQLAAELDELRHCGEVLTSISDTLREMFGGGGDADGREPAPGPERPEAKLEDVRAALAEKSRSGHTAEVRELLKRHGADKLSQIEPQFYGELMKEAEAIGNGG